MANVSDSIKTERRLIAPLYPWGRTLFDFLLGKYLSVRKLVSQTMLDAPKAVCR